jgi:hypothetical protein
VDDGGKHAGKVVFLRQGTFPQVFHNEAVEGKWAYLIRL